MVRRTQIEAGVPAVMTLSLDSRSKKRVVWAVENVNGGVFSPCDLVGGCRSTEWSDLRDRR